ncbi:MAG TPA: acetyl-CoA carboxylase biotin carboxyl carrier protein [Alphaproteobacteria bacterium]|jgi:acetyl-CoA carboxylase biotin carboxyl carrier protein|nr:acetyl-CoA carboxylase biotin carboxyl carrier protein [Alphaproteobacteria bacterium]
MPKLEIDEALVRKLAVLLEETGLTELEFEAGQQRIRVTRGGAVSAANNAAPALAVPTAPAAQAPAAASPETPPQNAILSPMVGTAYVAPEPGAASFVSVGSKVAKGDTLLIIEAMKVMNPLHAARAGTVTQIFVSDGMPVEFGQPLLVIE